MNRLRFHILSLLIILGAMLQATAQDVMVTVNPVQPTLPPQAMLYVANPGNYFNVSLINSSGETQNVYLVMDLEQINPNSGLYVKIPAQYQPDKPITVPSGGTHILSMVEMKDLFNHVPNDRIATTPGLFSDYEGGAFGLLPEGQYRMRLVAYRWEPGRDTPVMVSSPSSGQCIFTICYKAQAPEFLMPMPGIGSSSDASVCTMDKQNALFTWKEPIVTCNPGAARFTYKFKVVQLIGGQTPDEAIEYNPAVYEKSGLMSPMLILPQERIRSMIDDMTYVARVTAEQSGLGSNYLNYSMVENDGKSDLRLFRFEPDATTVVTPPTPENKDKEDKKNEEEDDDEFDFGFGSGKEEVTDSVYNFRNPQIIRPSFPGNAGARKSFTGDDIGVEWKKAWFVGGVGERQDTVKINYEVQLFRGEPEMDRADIFASEPVYTHSTYDLSDSIKWEKISDKVVAGDYMVLRVLPKSECTVRGVRQRLRKRHRLRPRTAHQPEVLPVFVNGEHREPQAYEEVCKGLHRQGGGHRTVSAHHRRDEGKRQGRRIPRQRSCGMVAARIVADGEGGVRFALHQYRRHRLCRQGEGHEGRHMGVEQRRAGGQALLRLGH